MKPKQLLLTLALFLSVAFIKAQDKYEFAIIEYTTFNGGTLSVSIDGVQFSSEILKLTKEEKKDGNAKPLLKKVKELQNENWEVMSFTSSNAANVENHFAYLRKKII